MRGQDRGTRVVLPPQTLGYKKWWKEPATADAVSHGTAVPERLGRV